MARSLSLDLRERVVAAVSGGMSRRQAAERFGVSAASAIRWCARDSQAGSLAAKPRGGDRHSARIEAQSEQILALVDERDDITLAELQAQLAEQGHRFGIGTLWRFFARIPVLYRAIRPFMTIFNAFPRPAFAPIFILWFGLGTTPKVAVAITIVYFVLVLNTMAGIHSLNADIRFLSRSLRMSRSQLFFLVELPHAAPTIVAGLRLGAVYSVLGVVVSEIVAANQGLGQLLVQFTNQFAIADSFAVLILMAALAIVLDFAVSIVQRRMTWAGTAGDH